MCIEMLHYFTLKKLKQLSIGIELAGDKIEHVCAFIEFAGDSTKMLGL